MDLPPAGIGVMTASSIARSNVGNDLFDFLILGSESPDKLRRILTLIFSLDVRSMTLETEEEGLLILILILCLF